MSNVENGLKLVGFLSDGCDAASGVHRFGERLVTPDYAASRTGRGPLRSSNGSLRRNHWICSTRCRPPSAEGNDRLMSVKAVVEESRRPCDTHTDTPGRIQDYNSSRRRNTRAANAKPRVFHIEPVEGA